MKSPVSISVVTIVYNGAAYIERAVESVLAQNYPDLEYVVIDGGSTDSTLDILEKYTDRISTIISEPDQGISDAFNKGIALCKGEVIGLLNADDQYAIGALQSVAEKYEGDGIYYGNMQMLEDGVPAGTYFPDHNLLEKDMTLCHPATFISKDFYHQWGVYRKDFRYAMDYELLLRMKSAGARFYKIDQLLAVMATGGVSDVRWLDAFNEVQRARKMHLNPGLFDQLQVSAVRWRKRAGHALKNTPLSPLVAAYHRWFSLVRKR